MMWQTSPLLNGPATPPQSHRSRLRFLADCDYGALIYTTSGVSFLSSLRCHATR
jgi:hypothetical protein